MLCGFAAAAAFGAALAVLLPAVMAPVAAVLALYGCTVIVNASNPAVYPLLGLSVADSRERTYRETAPTS